MSVKLFDEGRPQGCRILLGMSEEEAAKCLILMDVVRCPRIPNDIFTRQFLDTVINVMKKCSNRSEFSSGVS